MPSWHMPTFELADHAVGNEPKCFDKLGNNMHESSGAWREIELTNVQGHINDAGYTEVVWILPVGFLQSPVSD